MSTDWMRQGNCRDHPPSTFFPSDGVGVEVARRICATCPVKAPCLEYALRNGVDHGVWGGASERERRRIARQRRLARAASGPACLARLTSRSVKAGQRTAGLPNRKATDGPAECPSRCGSPPARRRRGVGHDGVDGSARLPQDDLATRPRVVPTLERPDLTLPAPPGHRIRLRGGRVARTPTGRRCRRCRRPAPRCRWRNSPVRR